MLNDDESELPHDDEAVTESDPRVNERAKLFDSD